MSEDNWDRFTRAVHAGREEGRGLAPGIERSSTFRLESAEEGAGFTQATQPSTFYTRWGNPTNRRLEQRLASLEGAEAGLVTASGMGAISSVLLARAEEGSRIVAQTSLYSATTELLENVLEPRFGVDVELVPQDDLDAWEEAVTPETDLVYLETPSNPTMVLTDVGAVADLAHEHDALVAVDNTFANPLNQRPLDLGADVVVHSTTKSLGGHSDVTGGAVLCDEAFLEEAWYHYKLLGATADPQASFLVLRGLQTLALRTEQMNRNAQAVAEALEAHDAVARVHYPGLTSHPQHDLAERQMLGFGGMLSFELAGGLEAGRSFVEGVEVATLAVSLGGTETLVEHPATMTHGPLSPEQREAAGIGEGLVRVSAGIEGTGDLVADVERTLDGLAT